MNRVRAAAVVLAAVSMTLAATGVASASDDPDFATFQYGPQQLYAPEAWTVTRGAGVTIAIVDSGVEADHPDLRDKMVAGYDYLEDDDEPQDTDGHGTHVAGIAAAMTDNGIGIAGVAPDSKIMPIRVLAGEATSPRSILSIQEGIRFAVDNGAKVINLSLTEVFTLGPESIRTLETSCLDAWNAGALCIIAAGNDGKGKPSGYSNDLQALLVAANDRSRDIAEFSQRADSKWSVTAPGVGIHSTVPGSGYGVKQGTSMAAPHVAGVAALLFSQGLTNQEVVDRILETATPLNDGGGTSGAGLVNAAAAVGAEFTPATTAPPRATATTTTTIAAPAAPSGGGGGVSTTTAPVPVDLTEGVIDDDDAFVGGDERDEGFLAAGGDFGDNPEEISLSRGYDAAFLTAVAVFLVILGVLGAGARRLVVKRGIGRIKT